MAAFAIDEPAVSHENGSYDIREHIRLQYIKTREYIYVCVCVTPLIRNNPIYKIITGCAGQKTSLFYKFQNK